VSETTPPEASGGPSPRGPDGTPASAFNEAAIRSYVLANYGRSTPQALSGALIASGHDPSLVASIMEQAAAHQATEPVRARARRVVSVACGLTYLVFAVGLLGVSRISPYGPFALAILTVALGLAFWISWWWAGRRSLTGFLVPLVLPAILLALVGGACYATTGAPLSFLGRTLGVPLD